MTVAYSPICKTVRSSDDTLIYAEAIGNPKNPCIVLVHGFSLSAAVFDNLFADKKLLDNLYMVRLDLRGHGRSGMPLTIEGHASSLYADDFMAIVKAFNLDKPIVVGWSYGCSLVADICSYLHPLPISGAVYLSGLPYTGPVLPQVASAACLAYIGDLGSDNNTAAYQVAKQTLVREFWREPSSVPFSLQTSWLGQMLMQPPVIVQHILVRLQDPEGLHRAGRGGLPLLVVYGTEDKVVNGDVAAKVLQPHFRDIQTYVVEGGSHAIFYDNQEDVSHALLKFVRRVKQSRT